MIPCVKAASKEFSRKNLWDIRILVSTKNPPLLHSDLSRSGSF